MITSPKRLRLLLWQVSRFWQYWPEIRWFFWGIRLRLALVLDRLAGRTPLLFALTVWGHQQFIRPVMEKLRQHGKKYSFYLILDQQEGVPKGDLLGVKRWRVRPYCEYLPFGKWFAALLAADIAERHPRSSCSIRIDEEHGLPSKFSQYNQKKCSLYTHIFALGPLDCELWEQSFALARIESRPQLCPVGYPKSDGFIRRQGLKREIVSKLGLNPDCPTVLYAPAFNRGGALERYGNAVFTALSEMRNVNVMVKLHPVSYDKSVVGVHSGGVYWPDVVERYARPGFCHVGNVDVSDCLIAADVMVTDVSGVALEFFLLDKPVVYLDSPDYYQSIGMENGGGDNYFVNAGRPAGVEVKDMPSMVAAIREALANPKQKARERCELAKRLLFNPGKGTDVFVETLENLLATRPNR